MKFIDNLKFLLIGLGVMSLCFACTNLGEVDPLNPDYLQNNSDEEEDVDESGNEDNEEIGLASFEASRVEVRIGDEIKFINTTDVDEDRVENWLWRFGDGQTDASRNPSHIFKEKGTYEINLTITEANGKVYYDDSSYTIVATGVDDSYDKDPTILWQFDTHFRFVNTSPVLYENDELLYVVNDAKPGRGEKNVYAVDLKEGVEIWSDLTEEVMRSTPSVDEDGTVYVGSYDQNLYAYTAEGSLKWLSFLGGEIKYSSVAIADGRLYVGAGNTFFALNKNDGSPIWSKDVGSPIQSTPAVGEDGIVFFGSNNAFYAINPSDGSTIWKDDEGGWNGTKVAIGDDGTVYFGREDGGSDKGRLIAYNPSDGSKKWVNAYREKISYGGPSIAQDGTIYIGTREAKTLYALNPEDGSVKWSYTASGEIESVPAVDDHGNVYFGDNSGLFYILSENGKEKYNTTTIGTDTFTSPIIGEDGIVYMAARAGEDDEHGYVYAFRTEATGPAISAWPMQGRNARSTNNAKD